MPRQVFVSHASADRQAAEKFAAAIEAAGVSCWLAFRDIPPGSSYSGAILDAIEASGALVVILSSRTSASAHVVREVERAVHKRLLIVPVRIENVSPGGDLEYFLSAVQWIDAFPEIRDDVIRRVVDGVGAVAGGVPPPAALEPAARSALLVSGIRHQMLATTSYYELRRLLHELEAVLYLHPHDPEARMLHDDLKRAVEAAAPRAQPMYARIDPEPVRRGRGQSMLTAAAGLAVLIVAGAASMFGVLGDRQTGDVESTATQASAPARNEDPHAPAASSPVSSPDLPAVGAEPTAAAARRVPIRLVLEAKAFVWVSLRVDGEMKLARVLNAGERETHAFRESVALDVGDAAAITFTIDGRRSRPIGPPGTVRTLHITRTNFREFVQ